MVIIKIIFTEQLRIIVKNSMLNVHSSSTLAPSFAIASCGLFYFIFLCFIALKYLFSEIQRVPLEQMVLKIRILTLFAGEDVRVGTL